MEGDGPCGTARASSAAVKRRLGSIIIMQRQSNHVVRGGVVVAAEPADPFPVLTDPSAVRAELVEAPGPSTGSG
ncbi:hypothetical protein GCM10009107_06380 [Ideonella azotifigens]|uniref:Uncharacterized protein n=1 Tax=Ideonella azotifigens TaxID=513160 RepID=A0ABN1JMD3_9BURK